jgi:PadR family transcriptional regulator PadR
MITIVYYILVGKLTFYFIKEQFGTIIIMDELHSSLKKGGGALMNIQFKKGVLELCVLSLLLNSDRYGYELAHTLSDTIQISDGTVYPILRKLAADGFVTTYLQESSGGPPRKYYAITQRGRTNLFLLKKEWLQFISHVNKIMEETLNEKG